MKAGFCEGRLADDGRPNWDDSGPRPLAWSAWYPAADTAVERSRESDALPKSWFQPDRVAEDAPLRQASQLYPLVLLSHGTGGSAMGLAWLGRRLAQQGFIAVAVNHHGNTYVEAYRAEGFLCLWERARDLTVMLDGIATQLSFSDRIDRDRVYLAGFSAGAFAALLLLGARLKFSQYEAASPIPNARRGPREFPDLAERLPDLLQTNAVFRAAWQRRSEPYHDARFKAALLCAPGRSVLGLSQSSLQQITTPVRIIVGEADAIAPPKECAAWVRSHLSNSRLELLSPDAGHYVFLPEATEAGRRAAPEVCRDAPGLERRSLHDQVAKSAAELFQTS